MKPYLKLLSWRRWMPLKVALAALALGVALLIYTAPWLLGYPVYWIVCLFRPVVAIPLAVGVIGWLFWVGSRS